MKLPGTRACRPGFCIRIPGAHASSPFIFPVQVFDIVRTLLRPIAADRIGLIRWACVFLLVGCAACSRTDALPRNMSLTAFNPHRAAFKCKHEADVIPSIDQDADRWNRRAMALTSSLLWPNQRDYKGAVELWTKAAERKHWKAMLNLANAYAQGDGVDRDAERAVQIAEQAMKLGVPAAYDLMGTYYMNGTGVKQDASRAYGFWQLAADMGNPNAMAYLGGKMDAVYDDPKAGFWGNRKIALQMLECGFAQGNGDAAYALGTTLVGSDKSLGEDNERALRILHDGVKYGSARSAAYLFGAFDDGDPVAGNAKDRARAERYIILADRLERDPDLRLPNLDKVLPLPPARLPKWNGDKKTLIDAAKAVISVPVPPSKPAMHPVSLRTGRAHVPDGYMLPEKPHVTVPPGHTRVPGDGHLAGQHDREPSSGRDVQSAVPPGLCRTG
ncbi:TPA: DUF6396 domain-containing protein [Burkholderia ambifaria]